MKKIILVQLSAMFCLASFANAQALQVVRIQTDDLSGYLAWAEQSASALLGDNEGTVVTCVPRFGAEDGVDAYWVGAGPNMEALLSLDLNGPVVQRETVEVADLRTVVARDVFLTLKPGAARQAGDRWVQNVFFVETAQPARYVELLQEQERAFHENGFDDVAWQIHAINTGDYSGLIHAALSAPTGQRLGEAIDAVSTASWSNFARGEFNGMRTIARNMIIDCAMHASNR